MEEKLITQLKSAVNEAELEHVRFYEKGNKSAGTRLRKHLQEIKNLATLIRKDVQEIKNNVK